MVKLTDEQWERIREHFPEERRVPGRAGRKPIPTRRVLEAVLWILNTGAQWHMLPAVLFELQDRASPLSDVVPPRGAPGYPGGCGQYAPRAGRPGRIGEFH